MNTKHPDVELYDTYRREIHKFIPISKESVSLYACGPTVYDYAHLGNLRSYLFVDVLRRVLELNGFQLNHVMNITDVGHLTSDADSGEDKMEKGARKQGKSAWDIAKFFEKAFFDDLDYLGIKRPTTICRATEHIPEQIEYVEILQQRGYTYQTSDGVYFDTAKLPSYGKLAKLDIEGLQAGARVDIGEKKRVTDFALWKFSPDGQRQMQWSSPWGDGFPGWHIECSAMSEKYLGNKFDIHVGGEDHIPVHHSNEIAQCEGRHDHQPANFWMHGYFLQLGKEKLSKSGKSLLLSELINQGYDPLAFRYLVLTSHYRSHLQFSIKALDSAATALKRLTKMLSQWPDGGELSVEFVRQFMQCINSDLKTPQALAVLWAVTKSALSDADKKATILYFDQVLALSLERQPVVETVPQAVLDLAEQRQQARAAKHWQQSDELREQILKLGFAVKDSPQGCILAKI